MLNLKLREISYEVYDERGNSVGCVIMPRGKRVVGKDQGTVLLRRPSGRQRSRMIPGPGEPARKAS